MCSNTEAAKAPARDNFYWLGQINKATDIINTNQGLLTQEQGHRFAQGIQKVLDDGNKPNAARPNLVITFEPLLIAASGPEITMLHAGRSSQDMLTTISIVRQREQMLELAKSLNDMQATLLELAQKHRETIIPNYTNGVAAQPNSLAHYLLGYAVAFERDQKRLEECYARLNRSPMGATVLNGTGWPLNRDRMAAYLGFDELAYNTYDAGQIYPNEAAMEIGGLTSNIAIHITSFIEEIMQQYAQPRPWILLKEGNGNTYVSSAMPQKRNPGILNRARKDCGTILGEAVGTAFRAHNIPAGMADGRLSGNNNMLKYTIKVVKDFDHILDALDVKPERALEELNLDWTCSQEIADVLMRKYKIPFRTGHHFASEIVTYARTNNVPPSDFTYAQAQGVYAKVVAGDASLPKAFPMSEEDWKAALNPVAIVNNRAVKGGPQAAELDIMLRKAHKELEACTTWQVKASQKVKDAEDKLNRDFEAMLK
ncbi:MAG: argininosuccinate lyase [Phascolarctobacterium sp.]|nr:argininosuccinate lyase [Phascolarctobacterium sp.]